MHVSDCESKGIERKWQKCRKLDNSCHNNLDAQTALQPTGEQCDLDLEDATHLYRFVSCKLNFSVFTVSLENVLLDVKELQRGMELTKREYSMHGHNTMLKEFIAHNESKLKKLQDDAKIAQVKG